MSLLQNKLIAKSIWIATEILVFKETIIDDFASTTNFLTQKCTLIDIMLQFITVSFVFSAMKMKHREKKP